MGNTIYTPYDNIIDIIVLHSANKFETPFGVMTAEETLRKVWFRHTPEKAQKKTTKDIEMQKKAWSTYKARVCIDTLEVQVNIGKDWVDFGLRILID